MKMTMTEAIEQLSDLINEDLIIIDDGATTWDIHNLKDETRENDDGTIYDLAVSEDGITQFNEDGYLESIPLYRVLQRFGYDDPGMVAKFKDYDPKTYYNPKVLDTPIKIRDYGIWLGKQIMSWDRNAIEDLKEMLDELNEVIEQLFNTEIRDFYNEERDFGVDMSAFPTHEIPGGKESYPIWAMDKEGDCLVGDTADQIENIKEILEG